MANIKDVAKLANVGIGTVSRVINDPGSVSKKSRAIVEKAMIELNYIPNATGRFLKMQKTMVIGFIIPNISQAIFSQLAYWIGIELDEMGYFLVTCNSGGNADKEIAFINMVKQNRMDGIIIITDNDLPKQTYLGVPTVTVDTHLAENIPIVSSENYEGGRKATEFLIKRGCSKLGFIGIKLPLESEVDNRWKAFCDVCGEHNLPYVCELASYRHGEEAKTAKEFIDQYPDLDGIFATSDYLAYSLYHELIGRGKQIPQDIQLIGFDGAYINTNLPVVEFTTVAQNIPEMGKRLARVIIQKIQQEALDEPQLIPTNLVEGITTKKT